MGTLIAIAVLVMLSSTTLTLSTAGEVDTRRFGGDLPPPVDDGVQVLRLTLSMDDEVIMAQPKQGWETTATGTVQLTGIPPNTDVEISAEVDREWELGISPGSVQYVRPQTSASFDIAVRVKVPFNSPAYMEGVLMVTVTAVSPTSPAKTANAVVRVYVGQLHDLEVDWRTKRVECCQNESFQIKGYLTNKGNGDETAVFIIEKPFPGVMWVIDYATVPVGETTNFSVNVKVPDNATLGEHPLKIHCFTYDGFFPIQEASQEIELIVLEERPDRNWEVVAVGTIGLIAGLGLAYYYLKRERTKRMAEQAIHGSA